MVDPTFGWGQVVIDALIWFLNRTLEYLFGRLFRLLGDLFGGLGRLIRDISQAFAESIRNAFDALFGRWQESWDIFWRFVNNAWDLALAFMQAFNWVVEFCKEVYSFFEGLITWLFGQNDEFGEELGGVIQDLLTWFGDFIFGLWEQSQNFIFHNGQWLYEWILSNLDRCVAYFINLIHDIFNLLGLKIELPAGALDAIRTFLEFGMFFDKFFPIRELFQLLGIFLLFLVMMSMVRFVRSLIPFFR